LTNEGAFLSNSHECTPRSRDSVDVWGK